jgi:hypothetical protein
MPSAIIAGQCVDLIDHHGSDICKQTRMVRPPRYEHDFQGLWRCEQNIRRFSVNTPPVALSDIAVPEPNPPA